MKESKYLIWYGGDEDDCRVVEADSPEQAAQQFIEWHGAGRVAVYLLPTTPLFFHRVVRVEREKAAHGKER